MNTKIAFASVLLCLSYIGSVIAQSIPPNVDGIEAVYENDELKIMWEASEDASGIAFYRIYYGRQSIMESNGDYDDFERTEGPETEYIFPVIPYEETDLYIAVLAINNEGIESDAFLMEASVTIPAAQSPLTDESGDMEESQETELSEESQQSVETIPQIPFLMTHALTLSHTEVSINFTKPLDETYSILQESIIILDEGGTKLDIIDTVIRSNTLEITTVPQNPESLYTVASIGMVRDEDGNILQPSAATIVFRGHPQNAAIDNPENDAEDPNKTDPTAVIPPLDTVPPEDAQNLVLQRTLRSDGTYNVEAMWDASPDTQDDLQSYEITASRDGRTYANPQNFEADTLSAQYTGVSPGILGVMVKTRDQVGNISQGISQIITLPETGVGLIGMLLLSGALAGRKVVKHRTNKK